MAIKFGLCPRTEGPPGGGDPVQVFEEAIAEAQEAEGAGFDSCFITEHHQAPDGYFPSPLVVAAAVAAQTSSIKIGTAVLLLPLCHPMHVAEDAAIVDIVSKGRLILGLGMGYQDVDFDAFGVPKNHRVSLFEEGIEIIKRAWTEERFSFHGKRYQLENVTLTPKPLQRPRPPIWLGAAAEEALRRTGRLGDAWITDPTPKIAQVKRRAALYTAAAREDGREPQIIVLREAWVGPTREEAIAVYGPAVLSSHLFYWRHGGYYHDVKTAEELTIERVATDRLILGSPADCIAQIEQWHRETGAEYFILRFRHSVGPALEEVREAIRLFGRAVIPHFR